MSLWKLKLLPIKRDSPRRKRGGGKKLIPSFSLCLPNSECWTLAMPCGGSQKRKQYCFSGDVSSMFHLHSAWPNAHVKCTQTHTLRCNGFITVNRPSKVGEILNGWWITMGGHSRHFSNFTYTHTIKLSHTLLYCLSHTIKPFTHTKLSCAN